MRKCLGLVAAVCAAASAGWAVDWKILKPQGYVSDFAGVIDSASKARLEDYAANLRASTGAQIALVTIPSLQGEPIEDVANTIARAWGVGQKGENNGVLLLLAIQDRRSRFEIGDGLERILPDGIGGNTLSEMRPALRAQHYGEAMMAAAETLGKAIAQAKQVQFQSGLPRQMRPTAANSVPWIFVVLAILLPFVLAFLLIYAVRRACGGKRAFRPSAVIDSDAPLVLASSAPSGGGFGSPDSSDSFGGFGGGDFGGGGSSGDW